MFALAIHPLAGIGAAFGAEFLNGNLVLIALFLTIFFLNLPLNGQAVAIPTGDIGGIFAQQALRAHDHVFEDMVERMANMHVAIRIGRAIMQDELFPALPRVAQAAIQVHALPACENARLLLRQAGLHRKVGLGQEHSVAIVAGFRSWRVSHSAGPYGKRAGK